MLSLLQKTVSKIGWYLAKLEAKIEQHFYGHGVYITGN